jgi:sterol desaturase/sphingolipid hydroxylase (fatty acid hydroxylase superfamily)
VDDHLSELRLVLFIGLFAAMAFWEAAAPWRIGRSRRTRWPGNLGVAALGAGVGFATARLAAPFAPVAAAWAAQDQGWGLLNWIDVPASALWGFLALDLVIYLQHRAFHTLPALWPIHRMHHADTELDVSTGLRFHPIEILLSLVVKTGAVFAIGPAPGAVIAFEIVLNATSMFNHGNVRIPEWLDRYVRWLVVTPAMHRVHHSVVRAETDSNFSFNFPWWDRLFGTYRATPTGGAQGVTIGLPEFRSPIENGLGRLLSHPFRRDSDSTG